jgi:hypothetical protein
VLAEDGEVVAVIDLVLLHRRAILARIRSGREFGVGVVPCGNRFSFLVGLRRTYSQRLRPDEPGPLGRTNASVPTCACLPEERTKRQGRRDQHESSACECDSGSRRKSHQDQNPRPVSAKNAETRTGHPRFSISSVCGRRLPEPDTTALWCRRSSGS